MRLLLAAILAIAPALPASAQRFPAPLQPSYRSYPRAVSEPESYRVDGLTRDGQYVTGTVTNGYRFNGTVNGLGRYCLGAGCQYW